MKLINRQINPLRVAGQVFGRVPAPSVSSSSAHSNTSTVTIFDHVKKTVRGDKVRRGVYFAEEHNELYANTQITKEDCKDLWYSSRDYVAFKQNVKKLAHILLKIEREDPWFQNLTKAYQSFRHASSVKDIECIMNSVGESYSSLNVAAVLGMEKWILREVVKHTIQRRAQLYQQIRRVQASSSADQSSRTKMLRKASRGVSGPGRMYAHYVAQVAAHATGELEMLTNATL